MRYLIAFILMLCLRPESWAQDTLSNTPLSLTGKEKPVFPGGEKALREYLDLNLRYPNAAIENKTEGYVILSFKIDIKGKVKDARILKSLDPVCDREALRVVAKMPDWEPARKNGEPVEVMYYLPIDFELPSAVK